MTVRLYPTENQIQATFHEALKWRAHPPVLGFSMPQEGVRSRAFNGRLAAAGMTAGLPDYCVLAVNTPPLFLEFKSERGRLRPSQRAFGDQLKRVGAGWFVVRSVEDAFDACRSWGVPLR